MRTIKQLAELAGTTVRTLHHYDSIGLLVPSARSEAGYRLYGPRDLERLQQILIWRRLDFSLAEIASFLDDPDFDVDEALRLQQELVAGQLASLSGIAAAIEAALAARQAGTVQQEHAMFDGFDPADFAAEAQDRWGDTVAYRESARRTKTYGEREWGEIRRDQAAIARGWADLVRAGADPTGPEARRMAERARRSICEWFYECSPEMHKNISVMYTDDPRFLATIDKDLPGIAQFSRRAIHANAEPSE